MSTVFEQLNPDALMHQTLSQEFVDSNIPESIIKATADFNTVPYEARMQGLRDRVRIDEETGIEYALISRPGDSTKKVVAAINPFGNDRTDNMLGRLNYLHAMARATGITDQNGDTLPFLMLSAPANNSSLKLNRQQLAIVSKSSTGIVAEQYAKATKHRGFGEIALHGFSLGATLATQAAYFTGYEGMDVSHLVVGDPANVKERSRLDLLKSFGAEAKHLKADYMASGVDVSIEAHENHESDFSYLKGVFKQAKINKALLGGLTHPTFADDLRRAACSSAKITVAHGSESLITPKEETEKALKKARLAVAGAGSFAVINSVEFEGAHHSWGDRLSWLATVLTYGLSRQI